MPKPMSKKEVLDRFIMNNPNCEAYIAITNKGLLIDGYLSPEELFNLFLLYNLYYQENKK